MKTILTTLSALLIASAAAADEYLYLFVSAKDGDGGSVRGVTGGAGLHQACSRQSRTAARASSMVPLRLRSAG